MIMKHHTPIAAAISCIAATLFLVAPRQLATADGDGDPPSAGAAASEDKPLDEQLLDGLDNELMDDLETIPDAGDSNPDEPAIDDESPLDSELIDRMLEGDDIGDDADPHLRIGRRMQIAQERTAPRR